MNERIRQLPLPEPDPSREWKDLTQHWTRLADEDAARRKERRDDRVPT